MNYAHVSNGTIDSIGQPPQLAYDAGRWWDLRDRDPAKLAARGWLPVAPTERPDDTDTTTHDYSVTLVQGVPVETWTERPKTQAEIDAATQSSARETLLAQLAAGVTSIKTVRAAAAGDIATAETQRAGAVTLKGQATTQKAAVSAAAVPGTYQTTTITFLRDQLAAVIARQEIIIQGVADLAAYRKANDESTLVTDDSLLWLARLASGVITD